jgi:hypothetical protein
MDSDVIRELCRQITNERDVQRAWKLLSELRGMIALQYDEARMRIGQLAKRYHRHLEN